MSDTAKLDLNGTSIELPVKVGTENEHALDISRLRAETGYITLDEGYGNTGSCESAITFIDGEKGILRYRGIPIDQLGANSTFIETSLLLMNGNLPNKEELASFSKLLTRHAPLHEGMRVMFDGFGANAHPMAILSAMINAVSCYHPDILYGDSDFESASARLLSKVRTIAAASYKASIGEPLVYPNPKLSYVQNFLHMMFSKPYKEYELDPDVVAAMELFFILHADHEQNCSTSTVRMVGSSGANMFASCAAGVCALWGPLHGGANVAVLKQLEYIHENNVDLKQFIEKVKDKDASERLMGFGHRVYKNFDPRAIIFKTAADKVLEKLRVNDPLLDIARKVEEVALADPYFKERNLYPNVDFYSGIILRAIGIPTDMFTVMFAIGRMPGWMAHWKEQFDNGARIHRPRQVYTGETERNYVPMAQRS